MKSLRRTLLNPGFLTALALLLGSAAGLKAAIETMGIYLQKLPIHPANGQKFPGFPVESRSWVREGEDSILPAEVLETLGTQNYVSRWYKRKTAGEDGAPVRLEIHLAYYTGTADTVPHVPERCFVGGGLSKAGETEILPIGLDMTRFPPDTTVDESEHGLIRNGRTQDHQFVRMPRDLERLRMNITPFQDPGGMRFFAGYFFLANGGHVPTANDVRQLAFKLEDSYSYYAKVQLMSPTAQTAEELAALAADFLNEMLPDVAQRTPDWVEVEAGRYPARDARAARSSRRAPGSGAV